ncbi:MAG: hypothetical protein WBF53_14380 [Litorimonas sp.]
MNLMRVDGAMRPDGYLHVNLEHDTRDASGHLDERFVTFDFHEWEEYELWKVRTGCVYLDRGVLVYPKRLEHRDWSVLLTPYQLGFGRKGALIHALQLSEETIRFGPEDRSLVETRMQSVVDPYAMPHPKQMRNAPEDYRRAFGYLPENDG